VHPIANVAISKRYRPGVGEQSIGRHVVEVIMGIDDVFHRKTGELPNLGKELYTVLVGELAIGIDRGGRNRSGSDVILAAMIPTTLE